MLHRARGDASLFGRLMLGGHLRLPMARFHHRLMIWHRRMGEVPLPARRGLRFALAAPRGNAKSTIVSLALTLHDIAYARERYILLISATQRQAEQRLRALRAEMTPRSPLAQWFHPRFERRAVTSSKRLIEANGVRVEAFGAGMEMRGIVHDSWRPTKIVLDDAESSAAAESPRRRQRLHDWFDEVVEHLGHGYTHILAVGTILHPEGLLARLMQRPDFESMLCRSIEHFAEPSPLWDQWRDMLVDPRRPDAREQARQFYLAHCREMAAGAEVLWPEHEDYEQLQAQLVLQGRRAFFQEKQNQPLGPEEALFEPERAWRVRRGADGWELLPPPAAHHAAAPTRPVRTYALDSLRLAGYLDSAMGKGRGDFAALANVARAPDGLLLVLSMWIKRAPPSQQVAALFDLHAEAPFEALAVEGTGFQELLTMPIEEERRRRREAGLRHDLPVQVVRPTRRKEARIAALEPLLTSGRLALADNLPEEFWRELHTWPRSEHDDALDAVAGAVELAQGLLSGRAAAAVVGRRGQRGAY